MLGAAPTGFELFWQMYVLTYFAPVAQILLWLVQIVFFVYALVLLRRYVDFATGRTAAKVEAAEVAAAVAAASASEAAFDAPAYEPAAAPKPKIDVDEFVE